MLSLFSTLLTIAKLLSRSFLKLNTMWQSSIQPNITCTLNCKAIINVEIKLWIQIGKRVTINQPGKNNTTNRNWHWQHISIYWQGDFHFLQTENSPFQLKINAYIWVSLQLKLLTNNKSKNCILLGKNLMIFLLVVLGMVIRTRVPHCLLCVWSKCDN